MKFYEYKKMCALLLAGTLTGGMAVPAFGAEPKTAATAEKTETAEETETTETPAVEPMTLEEIQKQVLKNNRLQKTLELNYNKVVAGLSAIEDGLDDLEDAQEDAARARRQANRAAKAGQAGVDKIKGGADQLKNQLSGAMPGVGSVLGGALDGLFGGVADIESGLLSGTVKTASAMEDLVDSISEQKRDELEEQKTALKNTKLDLNKTKEDWNNEALAVTQLLVTKTTQVEKGITLLTEKQALLERMAEIEEKKAALGFSIDTDLSEKKLAVSEGAKELQDAKNGQVLLKRQLNDLMGRELDADLAITAPELSRVIKPAPAYSDELLQTAIKKNYKMETLKRDYQQAQKESKDSSKYDGQRRASKLDMDLANVAMEDQKATIANDLKKKLDRIDATAAIYQNQKDALTKAETEWERQQASAKLGLVSPVELQALELQYQQKELALMSAAYDYDMAWQEYEMFLAGTSLDIYDAYKVQIG